MTQFSLYNILEVIILKATKLPSGSWRARVYLGKDENGKPIYQSVTRPSEAECLMEASRLSMHHHETVINPGTMTLGEAIDAYIKSKSNILSPATIRGYSNIRRNHLQPEMDLQLRNINNQVAQSAINREAKTKSPKTVANVAGLLKTIVKQCTGKELSVSLPQRIDRDIHVLTDAECRKLVKAVEGDAAEIPVLLGLFLGLRRSEIMALTYDDWDSKNRILSINKASVPNSAGKFVQKTTKTRKSKRNLPVPDYLAKKLDNCVANDIPFCPIHISAISRHLSDICEREDLPHVGLHALRHQNASMMLALGTPDKYAMERGGWSSNATMKKIYQHTMDDQRTLVNDKIGEYFDQLTKEPVPQNMTQDSEDE